MLDIIASAKKGIIINKKGIITNFMNPNIIKKQVVLLNNLINTCKLKLDKII